MKKSDIYSVNVDYNKTFKRAQKDNANWIGSVTSNRFPLPTGHENVDVFLVSFDREDLKNQTVLEALQAAGFTPANVMQGFAFCREYPDLVPEGPIAIVGSTGRNDELIGLLEPFMAGRTSRKRRQCKTAALGDWNSDWRFLCVS